MCVMRVLNVCVYVCGHVNVVFQCDKVISYESVCAHVHVYACGFVCVPDL